MEAIPQVCDCAIVLISKKKSRATKRTEGRQSLSSMP